MVSVSWFVLAHMLLIIGFFCRKRARLDPILTLSLFSIIDLCHSNT